MGKITKLTSLAFFTLAMLFSGNANADDSKTVWAISEGASYNGESSWIMNFPLNDPGQKKNVYEFTSNYVNSGTAVDGIYYYCETKQQTYGYDAVGFYGLDLSTGKKTLIGDWSQTYGGTCFCSPTYDYSTGTMYALNSLQGGDALYKVNLEGGTVEVVCKFSGIEKAPYNGSMYDDDFKSISCNADGDMYGLSYWGYLYTINQNTGVCVKVGKLDCVPQKSGALQYLTGAISFDNDNGKLYLWLRDFYEPTTLYTIDLKTAKTTKVYAFEDKPTITGMAIPFTIAAENAPDEVTDFTLTPGANGANTALLSWSNPSSTYGGSRLSTIDSVVVYRNNVSYKKFTETTPGANMTFTDENVSNGYYSYRIVAFNAAGKGKSSTRKSYIGHSLPVVPTNIASASEGEGARVSWTAPVKGQYDGWFDKANMTYTVERYPDSVIVATGVKDTTYYDTSMPNMGKYSYSVQAVTPDGVSPVGYSAAVVAGPAVKVPHTFAFTSADSLNIWTIINADGGYGYWSYSDGMYGSTQGVRNQYAYDGLVPQDWLISPNIAMKAGQHYKITFNATTGTKGIPEILAFGFGQGTTIASQDSINQIVITAKGTSSVRQNLPVPAKDGNYNFSFLHRTPYDNFSLTLNNIEVSEDHEGYIAGTVKDANGKGIAGALVLVDGGKYHATTSSTGAYVLNYVDAGSHNVDAQAVGYYTSTQAMTVTELDTLHSDFTLASLPTHSLKGKVVDFAGEAVPDAKVLLSGYNRDSVYTDAKGEFTMPSEFENTYYILTVSKNRMISYAAYVGLTTDTDLGTITLKDDARPANRVKVTADDSKATVTWSKPYNDPRTFSHDNGTVYSYVNISDGDNKTLFGSVYKTPALLQKVSWYQVGVTTHYNVQLYVFPLDANGLPTREPVYYNSYVPTTDNAWTTYTLPTALDMPNGFMVAVSSYDPSTICLGRDNGSTFDAKTSCYIKDYTDTTESWHFIEQNTGSDGNPLKSNFMLRSYGIPYNDADIAKMPTFTATASQALEELPRGFELKDTKLAQEQNTVYTEPARTIDDRLVYNVYRLKTSDAGNDGAYTLVSEKVKGTEAEDATWSTAAQGAYEYAVKAVYSDGSITPAAFSDSIGKNMIAKLNVKVNTNTKTNEAEGALVVVRNESHIYGGTVGEDGNVKFDNDVTGVWKGKYIVTVSLTGFATINDTVDMNAENAYTLSYTLKEVQTQPFGLQIIQEDESKPAERTFVWNWPDVISDSFEDHEDFAVNSPGELGWQYYDGDNLTTIGLNNCTWPGALGKMAYMVFNASKTTPSIQGYGMLDAYTGSKCLVSFSNSDGYLQNNDWIISPRLYFTNAFKFKFYAKAADYSALEKFLVGYSMTTADSASFTWISDTVTTGSYYIPYIYDIPAGAKYVALARISTNTHAFVVDDISIGYGLSQYGMPAANVAKAPAAEGAYEYYIDDETKSARTDNKTAIIDGIASGEHTFAVRACYTSGNTPWTTGKFTISGASTGVTAATVANGGKVKYFDNVGRQVNRPTKSGVYIKVITNGDKTTTQKFVIK